MTAILLVEDDAMIASGLVYALTGEGYDVVSCANIKEALNKVDTCDFSLGLLDLCLPDGTGYELCERLRERGVAVIFLTAVDDEANAVRGLEMGADDYVTKPFRLQELLARIRAALRRQGGLSESGTIQIADDIQIFPGQARVMRAGMEIELTAVEYRLLLTFVNHKGQVLNRTQLLEGIWDAAGSFVNDNTLTVYVGRLREKLGDDSQNPHIIKTVRGMGYQLG